MLEYQAILDEILHEIQPYLSEGKVASYIPELARVEPSSFAMSLMCVDGSHFHVGASEKRFSIQSISKLFTLTLAMQLADDSLWERIGKEPSGTPFNSLIQLEYENGIPRNPFINAGALVVTDVILNHLQDAHQSVLEFIRTLCAKDDINFDFSVAKSEEQTGFRNQAMANFLKSFHNLENEPWINAPILNARQTKRINALMLTCGTYDSVGDFAYRVGLPAKSGVGGGILATLPGKFSLCVWSPRLNEKGNSFAGTKALELFTTKTKLSIF